MLLGLGSLAPGLPDPNSWSDENLPDYSGNSPDGKLPNYVELSNGIARTPMAGSSVLDKVLPVKTDAKGNARIYGMPPALAYSLVVILLGGTAYYAYRTWGHHLVIVNPKSKKRGRPRGRLKR